MSLDEAHLPQLGGGVFLGYFGMETDLIFNQGVDLPGFASYPLLETITGRDTLRHYCSELVGLAREVGAGVVLETPTWVANRDRGAEIGYDPARLQELNRAGVDLIRGVRDDNDDVETVLSCTVGPRHDAYNPESYMSVGEAQRYHSEQIGWVADTGIDMIGAYTLAYPEEAAGVGLAARAASLPVVVGFTVETDGRLPNGQSLEAAIGYVDTATGDGVAYYVINCAHPDHFDDVLEDAPWMSRVRGVIANASRCSHEELDSSEVLDDGDPVELGELISGIRTRFPHVGVVGGCCGTDMRHMAEIARATQAIKP
ncbi:MAG: homocysteine S-methyltransferase [Actinomycetia bacterium]|nr:homocysteine S-methyltransferase [Actinomycetes bacterium]